MDIPHFIHLDGDLARDEAGNVLFLKWSEADKYCIDRSRRLPTIKELATFLNFKGVRYKKPESWELMYKWISPHDGDGFYYNYATYQCPSGDLQKYSIWSSSVFHTDSYQDNPLGAYCFSGGDKCGKIGFCYNALAFRCVGR